MNDIFFDLVPFQIALISAASCNKTQQEEHIWAISEGIIRAKYHFLHLVRGKMPIKCSQCGLIINKNEILCSFNEHAIAKPSCLSCAAKNMMVRNVHKIPANNSVSATHYYRKTRQGINLERLNPHIVSIDLCCQ